MRICAPGGAGYVGSRLMPQLLKRGHDVVVLDLFLYRDHVFDAYKNNPHLTLLKADIRDLHAATQALKRSDAVIHLACMLSWKLEFGREAAQIFVSGASEDKKNSAKLTFLS